MDLCKGYCLQCCVLVCLKVQRQLASHSEVCGRHLSLLQEERLLVSAVTVYNGRKACGSLVTCYVISHGISAHHGGAGTVYVSAQCRFVTSKEVGKFS